MKKTVATILLVLPFILMFVISFMARIVSTYQFIYVDSVCFINNENHCMNDVFKLGLNETYDLEIMIYPNLATNKNVTYHSLNEDIVTINQEGIVTAKAYGITQVFVATEDGGKRAQLDIKVTDPKVSGIDIVEDNIEINMKEQYSLNVVISPDTAEKRTVYYKSSNSNVATVDSNGLITAKKEGETIITVTTADGGFTDTCVIKVNKFNHPFDLVEYENDNVIYIIDSGYYDLTKLIIIHDESNIDIENFQYEILLQKPTEKNVARIEGKYLIIEENVTVKLLIEVDGIDYKPTIFIQYKK